MKCSSVAIGAACDIQIEGRGLGWGGGGGGGAGRPKLTWKKLTEKDCRERKTKYLKTKRGPNTLNPHKNESNNKQNFAG